jgi:hypothetical protein
MNRHRSRISNGNTGTMTHTYTCDTPSPSQSVEMYSSFEEMSDIVTPDFRRRFSNGEIIMNPCSNVSVITSRSGGGSYDAVQHGTGCHSQVSGNGSLTYFYAASLGGPSHLTPIIDANTDAASFNALAGIDKTPYSFAEDLLECRETIAFLGGNTLSQLLSLATSYSARRQAIISLAKVRSPTEIAKLLSNLYLEFRFGFQPLVRSADNVIDSLTSVDRIHTDYLYSHGKGVDQKYSNSDSATSISDFRFARTVDSTCSTRATVVYKISNPINDWRYKYGLRNKDLLVGLWEVFPLSFMIDRLVNIKSAIRGLTNLADPDISIVAGCVSSKIVTHQTMSMVEQLNRPDWTISITPDVDSVMTTTYNRDSWEPSVSNVIPGFTPNKLIDTFTNVADLVALIIQRLR